MEDLYQFLTEEGIAPELLEGVKSFRSMYPAQPQDEARIPSPEYYYYGKKTWELAIAALLAGKNLLLAGVSFHINADASYLVGTDTFDGHSVTFRPGPIWLCAERGGFGILDEINMAKNEALAVLHAALDFRRSLDVPGYKKQDLRPETRFIATMNYGYAGTRDLNEALTSRFAVLDMPLITEDNFQKLISRRYPAIRVPIRDQFVRLYTELERKAESAEISDSSLDLRGLLDAIALIERGLVSGDALEMCIVNKSFDSYERKLIRDVISARIPADLSREVVFES